MKNSRSRDWPIKRQRAQTDSVAIPKCAHSPIISIIIESLKNKNKEGLTFMRNKKYLSKIISLVLVVMMLFSVMAISASAATTPANRTKAEVQTRLNTLVSRLEGRYFTTNGSIYRYNSGYNCCNANVIQTSWLKNTMGLVPTSASLMPIHYTNGYGGYITSTAYSCAGFANYCLWYLYASKSTDDVYPTRIAVSTFTKANLDKSGVWPGDVIRVGNSHSMIYISHNSSGVKVLDSNFANSPDNKVRVHTIAFGNWKSGQTMAITRGRNYSASSSNSGSGTGSQTTYFTTNFRVKSGAYTNAYSSYTCASYVGRVYTNDVITIQRIYSNGVAKLSCPWNNSGNKTVYCKVSELKFKATKYIQAYSGVNGSTCGRIYPNDIVTICEIYSSGWMKAICPWTGGVNKTIYLKCSSIY
mgnify:CR=1 FL=1